MGEVALLCSRCSQPLMYIKFSRRFRIVCDNHLCILFRECQGIILKEEGDEIERKVKDSSPRVFRNGYQDYLARQQERYRFARSLQLPSIIARDLRNKSKDEIEMAAKELVRV